MGILGLWAPRSRVCTVAVSISSVLRTLNPQHRLWSSAEPAKCKGGPGRDLPGCFQGREQATSQKRLPAPSNPPAGFPTCPSPCTPGRPPEGSPTAVLTAPKRLFNSPASSIADLSQQVGSQEEPGGPVVLHLVWTVQSFLNKSRLSITASRVLRDT